MYAGGLDVFLEAGGLDQYVFIRIVMTGLLHFCHVTELSYYCYKLYYRIL